MQRLSGRMALVTGAAQGLGEAIARRLAAEGCAGVAVSDVNGEKVLDVARSLTEEHGCSTLALQTDVTDEAQVEAMVSQTKEEFGRLDILVSNAGILIAHDLTEFPADAWRKVLDVNLYGYFLCA